MCFSSCKITWLTMQFLQPNLADLSQGLFTFSSVVSKQQSVPKSVCIWKVHFQNSPWLHETYCLDFKKNKYMNTNVFLSLLMIKCDVLDYKTCSHTCLMFPEHRKSWILKWYSLKNIIWLQAKFQSKSKVLILMLFRFSIA